MSMKVKKVEESTKPVIPVQAPSGLAPIPIGPLQAKLNSFKFFESQVAVIQKAVKKSQEEVDEDTRLQQWLHSYTVFNDTCTVSNDNLAPERVERQLVKGKFKRVRVNQIRASWLQNTDSWGDHEDTKQYYLQRLEGSVRMRKRSKVGCLQLVHSKPKYPDPWSETRPISPLKLIRKALKSGVVSVTHHLKIDDVEPRVQTTEFIGPPAPLEYCYPNDWDASLAFMLGADNEFIEKVHRFNKVGHCEKAISVSWASKRRITIDRVMYVKQVGYPAETIEAPLFQTQWEKSIDCKVLTDFLTAPDLTTKANKENLPKCTPTPVSDEERYNFHWSQKHRAREHCNLLESIKSFERYPLQGVNWETQRAQHCENRLLPLAVAVGKPYGGYSREELIALVKFDMANGILVKPLPIVEIPYNSLEPVDYFESDTTDLHLANSIYRVLDNTSEITPSEFALKVFESSNEDRHQMDFQASELASTYAPVRWRRNEYVQLSNSGVLVPKTLFDYKPRKTSTISRPRELEIVVKGDDDGAEAKPTGYLERISTWLGSLHK